MTLQYDVSTAHIILERSLANHHTIVRSTSPSFSCIPPQLEQEQKSERRSQGNFDAGCCSTVSCHDRQLEYVPTRGTCAATPRDRTLHGPDRTTKQHGARNNVIRDSNSDSLQYAIQETEETTDMGIMIRE